MSQCSGPNESKYLVISSPSEAQSCQGQSTVKSVINYCGRGDRRGDRNMSLNIALVL